MSEELNPKVSAKSAEQVEKLITEAAQKVREARGLIYDAFDVIEENKLPVVSEIGDLSKELARMEAVVRNQSDPWCDLKKAYSSI